MLRLFYVKGFAYEKRFASALPEPDAKSKNDSTKIFGQPGESRNNKSIR
jgi:hypothetical protein